MAREPRPVGPVIVRIVVVVVLAAVCVALGLSLMSRTRAADSRADRAAETFTPPPVSIAGPPLVSVISDETSGPEPGSAAARRAPSPWMSYVSTSLSVRIAPFIVTGSGYTRTGAAAANGGSTFVTRAEEVSTTSRVIAFIGGSADRTSASLDEMKAVTRAIAAARSAAPASKVLVVGPLSPTAAPPEDVVALQQALRSSAGVTKTTWIDPIARGWLQDGAYWTPSGAINAAGQRELGRRLTAVLRTEFAGS